MLLSLGAILAGVMPSVALGSKSKRPSISPAKAFSLPPAKRCVSGRDLSFRVLKLHDVKWVGATVKINGRRFKTIGRSGLSRQVKLTGLPKGRLVVSITARTSDGRKVTVMRTYATCKGKTPPPPQGKAAPGSYSGSDSQGYAVAFYVSADGQQVQDVTARVGLACSNGTTYADANFNIPQASISASGSFTGTSRQSTSTETITYSFSGTFHATGVAGQLTETITFATGTSYTCTSHNLSWSAARNAQGSQSLTAPQAGSYSGSDSQGYAVAFYVSAGGQQVQDVTARVGLACSNGTTYADANFNIPQASISASGSFTGTSTQSTSTETIVYTFTGHFHGLDTSGNTRAAGQLTETITFATGTSYTCTSHNLSWSAARNAQGSQSLTAPQAGSYSGSDSQGYAVAFYVSAGGQQVQDVTARVGLACSNGTTYADANFNIPQASISASGSFTGTSTQSTSTETIVYTFTGHFHGLDTSGNTRAAGQLTDTITFATGTSYTCTSRNLSWSATS